jgi:PAS domain S-box-containing protein
VFRFDDLNRSWFGGITLAVATGVAYFFAGQLGLALRDEPGMAVFWPAAGIAVGVLIALGPRTRLPVAAAVFVASTACSLTIGRNAWLSIAFALLNAGQALLTAWLLEHRFGRTFKLENVQHVLWFFAATAVGTAIAAVGAAVAISLIKPRASPLHVWGLWFAAGALGVVTVAPLLIGLGDAVRARLPRRELMEGWLALIALAALTVFLISLPDGPWGTALPEALVFPFLLWIAIRCRAAFAAGAALVVGLMIIGSTTLNVGYFDSGKPPAERVLAAQTFVFIEAILVVLLAAVFAERRRSEQATKQVAERLQLALDGVELGAFSSDFATGRFECDARTAQIHGHKVPPVIMKEVRRFVRSEDLERIDAALAQALRTGSTWNAEYRVVPPPDHPHAGETRWIAVESAIMREPDGTPAGLLGVTRDITYHKRAEEALAERNAQLELASKTARIGSYAIDFPTGLVNLSPGCANILGLPESTDETSRANTRKLVHSEDLAHFDAVLERAFLKKHREFFAQFRIIRANDGEVRWIEARSLIFYDHVGQPLRLIAVIIDFTDRRLAEQALTERNTQLALAGRAALVGNFVYDVNKGTTQISQGYATIHGLPEGTTETTISEWRARVHPEDLARAEGLREQAFADRRKEDNAEYRIVLSNGEVRWIERRGSILYDEAGLPERVVGVNIDVTERKRAEQALVERNILLALAGRAARVGTFAYDADKEILQISEDYAAIHGLPEGTTKIARSEWLAGVHPQDVERVELPRSEAFREQRNEYSAEFRIIRPGGEVRWVEIRCFITYHGNGHPKRVVGVSTDVTDRKQAELRLAERNAQFGLAQKATRVGTYTYDNIARTMQLTEASAAILGLPQGTTEITADDWRQRVHPDDLQRLAAERRHAFKERQPELVGELRIIRPTGEVRWIEARALISYGANGRPSSMIGVYIDVTERKRSEEGRKFLNAELDHRVKNALATVTAVISHTRQGSRSVAEFAAALEARIRSMAATHELLSARRWSGISLAKLVRRELAPYANDNNIKISGPNVALRPEAAQAMAMVIHELATNAAKHGALSTKKGRVSIHWDRPLNGRPSPDLALEWQEIGGPPVSAPANSGYGTSTICDLIPYEFGGTVDLVFAPEGVHCRLKLPANWLSDAADPGTGAIADVAAN